MPRTVKKTTVKRKPKASPKSLRQELKQDLMGIALLSLGLFVAFCLWRVPTSGMENILGAVGRGVYTLSLSLFGKGKWFLAAALIILGAGRWFGGIPINALILSAYTTLTLSCCAIAHLLLPVGEQTLKAGISGAGGGICGGFLVQALSYLIGITGCWILFVALILGSLLVITNRTLKEILNTAGIRAKGIAQSAQNEITQRVGRREERRLSETLLREKSVMNSLSLPIDTELRKDKGLPVDTTLRTFKNSGKAESVAQADLPETFSENLEPVKTLADGELAQKESERVPLIIDNGQRVYGDQENEKSPMTEKIQEEAGVMGHYSAGGHGPSQPAAGSLVESVIAASAGAGQEASGCAQSGIQPDKVGLEQAKPPEISQVESDQRDLLEQHSPSKKEAAMDPLESTYVLPPIRLLNTAPRIKSQRLNKDITDNVRILEETLGNFGVKAIVTQVNRGPSITRYELQPSPGVKVSKIVNLSDDIALALAAAHVRIEAPIPGKAAVGIEVPNSEMTPVSLREVLEDPDFQNAKSKLTFALGKDIAGQPIVADLAKMPHLLIAGSTGSGKSVCMNALIASILFNTHPDEVKMMMIDPKMVELSNYNGIPHLIHPVVTDPKKAATALRWAVHEMEKRYELFSNAGVKDIFRYNQWILEKEPQDRLPLLPQVVILIDELADLMMVAPADVEDAICRLAQMARAAGMHLVVATQRPSVDVITGIIKANIPSRIAFAVSSQIDSRTILDMGGAERLLGRGDMLFYPTGQPKPLRVQGVYVSDKEIEELTAYLKAVSQPPQYIEELAVEEESQNPEEGELDSLLPEAAHLFIENGQASISLLQRRLRIGYTRAARIIDQMEEQGIVGGYEGSKARTIRMTMQQYEERFSQNSGQN